jgi:hypothetical protein
MSVSSPSNMFPLIIVILFIVLYWTRYLASESVCRKFVRHNLQVPNRRCVCTRACWLTSMLAMSLLSLCIYVPNFTFLSYYHGDNSKQNFRTAMLPNVPLSPQVHVYFLLSIIMYQRYGWLQLHEVWGLGVSVLQCNRNERRGLPCFLIEVS